MGLNVSALDYLNRSVELYAAIKKSEKNFPNIDQPPWVLLNIGSIYFKNGDYKKATEKYNYALNLFEKVSKQNAKFLGYNTSKSNLGLIKEAQGNYKDAEIIYEEIYQRRLEKGKIEDILYSMAQIIAVKLLQGEVVAAHDKLKEAQSIFKKHGTKDPNSMITRNWGYAHFVFAAYYQSIKKYDGIIAMYHDQGLIPFKTLSFGRGVNYSSGLERIRTSPDHGTAYGIAGKGQASKDSFLTSIFLAIDIYKMRKIHDEYSKDKL